jgi:hypothetical protein
VVGILGIIFGAFGLIGGVQLIMAPTTMAQQKQMMAHMEQTLEEDASRRRDVQPPARGVFRMFSGMFDTPEWFESWCRIGGTLVVLLSGFYIFAAIWLLRIRPGAPGMFCLAASLGIVMAIAKVVVALSLGSLMSIGMVMGGAVGGVIDIVLLAVVVSGNKERFAALQALRV